MIKIIRPKDHKFHKPQIEALLDLFAVYQKLELSSLEKSQATFVIAENTTYGVYGGTILQQQPLNCVDPKIRQLISSLSPYKRRVWVMSLCFPVQQEESFPTIEQLSLCEDFYQSLLKNFIKFSKEAKTGFLVVKLQSKDSLKLKAYGSWPCSFKVEQNDSFDGLFYGILPLKPSRQINVELLTIEQLERVGEKSK